MGTHEDCLANVVHDDELVQSPQVFQGEHLHDMQETPNFPARRGGSEHGIRSTGSIVLPSRGPRVYPSVKTTIHPRRSFGWLSRFRGFLRSSCVSLEDVASCFPKVIKGSRTNAWKISPRWLEFQFWAKRFLCYGQNLSDFSFSVPPGTLRNLGFSRSVPKTAQLLLLTPVFSHAVRQVISWSPTERQNIFLRSKFMRRVQFKLRKRFQQTQSNQTFSQMAVLPNPLPDPDGACPKGEGKGAGVELRTGSNPASTQRDSRAAIRRSQCSVQSLEPPGQDLVISPRPARTAIQGKPTSHQSAFSVATGARAPMSLPELRKFLVSHPSCSTKSPFLQTHALHHASGHSLRLWDTPWKSRAVPQISGQASIHSYFQVRAQVQTRHKHTPLPFARLTHGRAIWFVAR